MDNLGWAVDELDALLAEVLDWKNEGDKIVFTNGCFDLLHYGHIAYLQEARALGDRLIVGVNSDSSVRTLKGNDRPIKDQQTRLAIMANLQMVDAAILFADQTPLALIEAISPDILVKGGDYLPSEIVGANHVTQHGGKVVSLSFIKGYSSSCYVKKIKGSNQS